MLTAYPGPTPSILVSMTAGGLVDALPRDNDPDALYEAFMAWSEEQGLTLYPHQEEAAIELFSGNNVILATPTGSGKSMVAIAAHFAAMAADERIHEEVVRGLAVRGRARVSGTFRAAVFGANDGLVSNLSLVLGVTGGGRRVCRIRVRGGREFFARGADVLLSR